MNHLPLIKEMPTFQNLSKEDQFIISQPQYYYWFNVLIANIKANIKFKEWVELTETDVLIHPIAANLFDAWDEKRMVFRIPLTAAYDRYFYNSFFIIDSCDPIKKPIHVLDNKEAVLFSVGTLEAAKNAIDYISKLSKIDTPIVFQDEMEKVKLTDYQKDIIDAMRNIKESDIMHFPKGFGKRGLEADEIIEDEVMEVDYEVLKPIAKSRLEIQYYKLLQYCQAYLDSFDENEIGFLDNFEESFKIKIFEKAMELCFGDTVLEYIKQESK